VRCPRRYRLLYVERREEPPNAAGFVGTVVHQALKDFFTLGPRDRSREALEAALRRAWARSPERTEVFTDETQEAEAGREALADLRAFFTKVDRRVVPFGLEVFLTTSVGEGVTVRGKVDRIDEVPGTGNLVVIDYKTGRVPPQRPNLIDDFQLALYQAMVDEAYSRTVEKVVLHYLKGNVTFEFEMEADDVERAKARALDLALRATGDREFIPKVSALCRFCSFIDECPKRAEVEARYIRPVPEPDGDWVSLPF